MKKSSWNQLIKNLKQDGLMFIGAYYPRGEETIKDVETKIINGINKTTNLKFTVNRHYKSGTTAIKMHTERSTISTLDKTGSVYLYNEFYLIIDKNLIMVYATKNI